MLKVADVHKHYGGVTALAGAGLALAPGEVHAVLGENGAGKSTLMKIIAGLVQPDAGTLELAGEPVRLGGPRDARAKGIGIVSQELSLFGDLDVLGNLFVDDQPRRLGLLDRDAMARRARPLLDELGLGELPLDVPLGRFTLAEQQLVEICRALLGEPRVLILDEPTSALPRPAVTRLQAVLRRITARGVAVLYVSHFLEEATATADRITVLRDGRDVLTGVPTASVTIASLVEAMLGEAAALVTGQAAAPARGGRRAAGPPGAEARRVILEDVRMPGVLETVSLTAEAGEVVGLAGLEGAGHHAVLRLLCGLAKPSGGRVVLPGGHPRPVRMSQAVGYGVAYIPSDRKRLGLMLDASVAFNIVGVSWLAARRGGWWISPRRMAAAAERYIGQLRIRGSAQDPVSSLSGGNQQKVVLAKWLAADPDVVLLDDPTRGVDVGAKAEVHAVVRELAAAGRVVLMCSTDLAELAHVCDRVIVMYRGTIRGELAGDARTEHALLNAINTGTL
jgi:ABC-type sugar transport system ATPase subunit